MSQTTQIPLAFANAGSKTPIDILRTDGVVDFTNGYTADYSRELGVDPAAKPVERDKLNYLLNLITSNAIDWQTMGFPQWISGLSYPVGSFVRYSPNIATTPERIYRCIVANTGAVAPLSSANWEELLTMAALQALIPMPEKLTISVATDFNTLTANATWEVQTDAIATGSPNSPSAFAGMLEVKAVGGANTVIVQRYSDRQGKVFFRGAQSGTWSAWQSITGYAYTPANQAITITGTNGLTGGGDLSANRAISLAAIAAMNIMANPTGAAAVAQSVGLANGIVLTGSGPGSYTLGLGNISSTGSITSGGSVSGNNFISSGTTAALSTSGTGGQITLNPNGAGSSSGQVVVGPGGGITTPGGVTASGFVSGATGIGTVGAGTQGVQIVWNGISVGQGRNEYINNFGGGVGGHYWYSRSSTSGGVTLNMSLDPSGNLTIPGAFTSGASVFTSTGNAAILQPGIAGSAYLRPTPGATTGQVSVNTNGTITSANTNTNPSANILQCGLYLSGAFGGGVTLQDPGSNMAAALFTSAGTFNIRCGTATGAASASGLSLDTAGNLIATGTIRPGSDERVKTNWKPIENALDTVRTVFKGFTYERTDDNNRLESGFGAQSVQKHLPHLVSVDKIPEGQSQFDDNGTPRDFHHLGYDNIVPYATQAIIELEDKVNAQETRIAELERQMAIVLATFDTGRVETQ